MLKCWCRAGGNEAPLGITGIACFLYKDPEGVHATAVENTLLPWGPGGDALVDRFDARLLLNSLPASSHSRYYLYLRFKIYQALFVNNWRRLVFCSLNVIYALILALVPALAY